MIAILVVSMVQGVFAQQIIIKGTVKDATSKKAAEYVNVVLQTADSHMTIWCLVHSENAKEAINVLHKTFKLS